MQQLIARYRPHVVVDLGTGDGHYVYRRARRNPVELVVGVDANAAGPARLSRRADRRPDRGGAPNALFLRANAAELPTELAGQAAEVLVQFPWGSLLAAAAGSDPAVLAHLATLCAPGGTITVILGLNPGRDGGQWRRLGLPDLDHDYLSRTLPEHYRAAGFERPRTAFLGPGDCRGLDTIWARRLTFAGGRTVFRLTATASQ